LLKLSNFSLWAGKWAIECVLVASIYVLVSILELTLTLFFDLVYSLYIVINVHKAIGLLSPLDEESNFPRATDLTLANKLRQHLQTNPYFKGDWGRGFSVCHYAGEVSRCSVFKELCNLVANFWVFFFLKSNWPFHLDATDKLCFSKTLSISTMQTLEVCFWSF
jgi:hypothetical protein